MLTPVYKDWSGGACQGIGSKRCKCNCGGLIWISEFYVICYVFREGGGGVKPGADTGFEVGVGQKLIQSTKLSATD